MGRGLIETLCTGIVDFTAGWSWAQAVFLPLILLPVDSRWQHYDLRCDTRDLNALERVTYVQQS